VLYHPADKPKRGQGGVLDLASLVVAVPIADRIAYSVILRLREVKNVVS
jgi:hypothetical protein